jgi:hypothetical protein
MAFLSKSIRNMEDKNELTGTQGLIGGVIFTLVVLSTIGFIKIPQDEISLGIQYAKENDVRDIAICEYKFDDNDIAEESCQEYVKSKYYFGRYKCEDDCSGHFAGYEWAEENNINNEEDCSGNSQSFIEGCKSFVEDNL